MPRKTGAGPVPAYEAQLASLVDAPPAGDGWLHEQKFDGYRIGLRRDGAKVELWSRRGQEWSVQFPSVAKAGLALAAKQALLDGEVAVVMPNGVTSFQALQNRASGSVLTYFAFDLLFLDGEDLRPLPLEERKERLRALLGGPTAAGGVIRYSDHVVGNGAEMLAHACAHGLEGIVSKKRDARYRGTRNADWVKTKCTKRQELVIGGFTDPEGSRSSIGALILGYYDGAGKLRWAGNVGTGPGWNDRFLRDLRKRLDALAAKASFFDPPVSDPAVLRKVHWVRPKLVTEVSFAEWTGDGRVRHASMQGLRADKDPRDVRREVAVGALEPAPSTESAARPRRPSARRPRR